jgi:Zn-dependent M28 family amino/carboxypeptidase
MGVLILALAGCRPAADPLDPAALADALAVADQVDQARLLAAIDALVAAHATEEPVIIEPWGLPHRHLAGTDRLVELFAELGLTAQIEETDEDEWLAKNVVVELPGSSRPQEVVLVTAHHDVWFTGADDNSSGVAVLLEAARILSAIDHPRTIRVVSFDHEEVGLIGSLRYYRDHAADDHVAVVNMDAVSFALHEPGTQTAPTGFTLPTVADFAVALANAPAERPARMAAQLAGALPQPLKLQGALGADDNLYPGTGDFHRSDHSAAWTAGIPAVFFSDTTNFRSVHYHTETDLPDTIDPDFALAVGRTVVALVHALALETQPVAENP